MGKGDQPAIQPQPAAPTVSGSMADYVANLPKLYEAQLEYLPQFAELAYGIGEQFYPELTGLTESLAKTAQEGMGTELPDWARAKYLDELRSNVGTNIGSPIAGDYISRGMLEQQENWKRYYQALSPCASLI